MSKIEVQHFDKLGRELKINDCVAYPQSNMLRIGKVIKLNPKMVNVSELNNKRQWANDSRKYPSDLVIIDGNDVTMYLLKG